LRICRTSGWQIAEIYEDVSSGARAIRPALSRLMLAALARELYCLLVWKLDRFGRSLVDCLNHIRTLEESGIRDDAKRISEQETIPLPGLTSVKSSF
jgi:DNA invertase Pin-like site-specific DNA recombinase